jgi:hypothetical protein
MIVPSKMVPEITVVLQTSLSNALNNFFHQLRATGSYTGVKPLVTVNVANICAGLRTALDIKDLLRICGRAAETPCLQGFSDAYFLRISIGIDHVAEPLPKAAPLISL